MTYMSNAPTPGSTVYGVSGRYAAAGRRPATPEA
jgi:hypothetical protein